MPQQKRPTVESKPISFRLGALQRDRLRQLMDLREQNQTAILNAALDLLYMYDIGFYKIDIMRETDLLTDGLGTISTVPWLASAEVWSGATKKVKQDD